MEAGGTDLAGYQEADAGHAEEDCVGSAKAAKAIKAANAAKAHAQWAPGTNAPSYGGLGALDAQV